ncbi:MAG TPA: hypothetical protein VL418_01765 [Devosiaceae bacterium]|jgi:flagellar assembly protein FliH|nr:hypothetical protein [Devosiaceae bacterium]
MPAAPAKFTFDLDLRDQPPSGLLMSEAARAELQQQARNAGYADGVAAGEHSAAATSARSLAQAADALGGRAAALLAQVDQYGSARRREAIELASTVGRKLAAALLAKQPAAELEALLIDCLSSLDGVPHLVIRCHPDLADAMRDIASARIATSGFTGRLIVMGDPDITLGDGRIEWADGGLVRDEAAISAAIDARIAAYLATNNKQQEEEIT